MKEQVSDPIFNNITKSIQVYFRDSNSTRLKLSIQTYPHGNSTGVSQALKTKTKLTSSLEPKGSVLALHEKCWL